MVCGAAGENPTKKGAALWVGFGLCRTSMRINPYAVTQADSRCACLSIKHTFGHFYLKSSKKKKDKGLKQDDQDQENAGTAADIRQDKCTSTDYTGQQSIMGAWSRTGVSLAHCPSTPINSFTCPYIYTSVHPLLRSSISCVRSSSHVPSPYLRVHSQVHPSTAAHATAL